MARFARNRAPVTGQQENVSLAIALKIMAVLLMLAMAALIKAARDVPPGQIVFARSFFAILPIALLLAWQGQLRNGLKTNHLWGHITRGLVGVMGMVTTFLALLHLTLADATAIRYATPLTVVVLSALMLRENVRLFRWSMVLIGFLGVMIVVWPNLSFAGGGFSFTGNQSFGIAMALSGAVFAAFAQVTVRTLTKTETSPTIVLYFCITASTFGLITLPFGWVVPTLEQGVILVLIGVIGGVGQIMMTQSYRYADMSVIAPFEYSSLIFSIVIGYLFFAELPTLHMITGGLIVTAAGIAIIWRERQLGVKREAKKISET